MIYGKSKIKAAAKRFLQQLKEVYCLLRANCLAPLSSQGYREYWSADYLLLTRILFPEWEFSFLLIIANATPMGEACMASS